MMMAGIKAGDSPRAPARIALAGPEIADTGPTDQSPVNRNDRLFLK
jgi:hypothetical protein